MSDATRGMVRSILALLEDGALTTCEALERLTALGIAPRVAGILLRQAPYQARAAA